METKLVAKSNSYAHQVLTNLPEVYTYHNLKHTLAVVAAAEEVGRKSGLSNSGMETVLVAAWFHDTGYEKGSDNHEQNSASTAIKLLGEWDAPQQTIRNVKSAIEATSLPQNPRSPLEHTISERAYLFYSLWPNHSARA